MSTESNDAEEESLTEDEIQELEGALEALGREVSDPMDGIHEDSIKELAADFNDAFGGNWERKMMAGVLWELATLAAHDATGRIKIFAKMVLRKLKEYAPSVPLKASATSGDQGVVGYYSISSTHSRTLDSKHHKPFNSEFTGTIDAVRVRLPKHKASAKTIHTRIGEVSPNDFLAFSYEEIVHRYTELFTVHETLPEVLKEKFDLDAILKKVDHVELVTGARQGVHRFCPVSIYLAYGAPKSNGEKEALFYGVQSANFFGQKAQLYFSKGMIDRPIIARSGFRPTPFADPDNCYRFWMDGKSWPSPAPETFLFKGQIYYSGDPQGERPTGELKRYMNMDLLYTHHESSHATEQKARRPRKIQAVAYARVCKLEDWQGIEHRYEHTLYHWVHLLASHVGKKRSWTKSPT